MFKARLYLDFDGVVNANKPPFNKLDTFDIKVNQGGGAMAVYPIRFAPFVVSELDRFRVTYGLELVWLSTWNDNLEVLRLPKHLNGLAGGRVLPCVLPRVPCTQREWTKWKADALLADQLNDNTPLVWVDDEALAFHKKDVEAATDSSLPRLFVEPKGWQGLRTLDLKAIENLLINL